MSYHCANARRWWRYSRRPAALRSRALRALFSSITERHWLNPAKIATSLIRPTALVSFVRCSCIADFASTQRAHAMCNWRFMSEPSALCERWRDRFMSSTHCCHAAYAPYIAPFFIRRRHRSTFVRCWMLSLVTSHQRSIAADSARFAMRRKARPTRERWALRSSTKNSHAESAKLSSRLSTLRSTLAAF